MILDTCTYVVDYMYIRSTYIYSLKDNFKQLYMYVHSCTVSISHIAANISITIAFILAIY